MGVDILIDLVYKIRIVLVNEMPKDLYSELLGHLRTNIHNTINAILFYVWSLAYFYLPS